MVISAQRVQLVTRMTEMLTRSGWSEDCIENLPTEVQSVLEWVPDKVFKKAQNEFALLEVEDEMNIPSWLVRTAKTHGDQLRNVKIIVAVVKDKPADIETVRMASDSHFSLFAGYKKPVAIFDPTTSVIPRIAETEMREDRQRFQSHKRIPKFLSDSLLNVTRLSYSGNLRHFAERYERTTFASWNDEHEFVHAFISEEMSTLLNTAQLEGLDVLSMLDDVSETIASKRPHFLHSFQTFLLGCLILDSEYERFSQAYVNCFRPLTNITIDIPWFLTSLFHDVAFPFENINQFGPVGRILGYNCQGMIASLAPHFLGAWFNRNNAGPTDPNVEIQVLDNSDPLRSVLMQNRKDHGVLGAITLLSSATDIDTPTLNSMLVPAAFAIAIHNSRIWPHIIEHCPFPIPAAKFPLAFLLLTCDNLQEWGREMLAEGENDVKALILRRNQTNNHGNFHIWVDDPNSAIISTNRSEWIGQKLFVPEDLTIGCEYHTS